MGRRWRVLCGVLASGIVGCAIKTPHLNISQWPVMKRAVYYQEPAPFRVSVLPLADVRPAHERTGKAPAGVFLLVWNRRVGDYYTGDHMFGGDVPGRLSGQLGAYLRSANAFAHVVDIPGQPSRLDLRDAAGVRALCQEHVADFLLTGELEHFFGSQSQHLSHFFLPLYFISAWGWQDSKSLPWGQTTMRMALYNGRSGDLIWRRSFETAHTMPRETAAMSEAALESFTGALEELTVELRRLPLGSQELDAAAITP